MEELTQGEWTSSHEQDGYTQILHSKGTGKEQLCSIGWGMLIPKEERDANGYLIAAIPELLYLAKIIADEAPWRIAPELQLLAHKALVKAKVKGN